MAILEVDNLRKAYGRLAAVDGISFAVARGECFGLLGPNGAGKTTTIRMLYGYTPRDAGDLTLFGLAIDGHIRTIKGRLGICQQEDSLDPDLSVRENLTGFARYFDIKKAAAEKRAGELLHFFALEGRAKDSIRILSGGLKRRLMLARALVNSPDLLILDEPTTGLDPQSRQLLWDKLAELKSQGLTILLTTHYMEEAERLCDRLVIIDHGRILIEGSPKALVRREIGHSVLEVAQPDAAVRAFLAKEKCPVEDLGHRLLAYLGDGDDLFLRLTRQVRAEGCTLRPASLEDLFLKLTGRELRE
ncbi:ABC-type multidrug transport system, ATPase component [Desulfuromonas soudanensis]|uniref:ABC-type multidrug transport system, ATPase component n=1 Tax=Desulfuromonas soudanensis TaxID=1603606 RepID=A0A0M4D7X3_9BACT|nr:ATP-binding cassette domain-containing protein [Desulfuromonas soudanensis]ALC15680.1 ABC-type multidrug transport system, ATPase component [Desulfuromonas soudanensis]